MSNASVVNYAIYENGSEYLGTAKITLPPVNSKVVTANGTGIAGDIDIPVRGHIDAMEVGIEFIDATEAAYELIKQGRHLLDCRVVHEGLDPVTGEIRLSNFKHILEVMPKTLSGGDVAPSSPQAVSGTYSCTSRKDYIDGKLMMHIDPLRWIFKGPDGVDILKDVRKGLGKA